ncbi:diaminopimelate epimerase [Streptococcus sp. X16XC17]|uniref:thioesterase family protein n=1 Tax=unclassified Streptococcus TaxID=2608887 RepID=UPI00066FB59E|nr:MULTISPECIES: thioesterase family protein [unclassified Streptococcus]TCD46444.1 diaminopimelate epimerase [Streptococcus sp. X16XC17]
MAIYTKVFETKAEHSAHAVGSGNLNVLSTPMLTAFIENAAFTFAQENLDDSKTTVGSEIALQHLVPSSIGQDVTVAIIALKEEGHKYDFRLEAFCGGALIAKGVHTRVRVNKDSFMEKLRESL